MLSKVAPLKRWFQARLVPSIVAAFDANGQPYKKKSKYEITDHEANVMIPLTVGVDFCYEHDMKKVGGKVTKSGICPTDGTWNIEYELRDDLPDGKMMMDKIDKGEMLSVSMRHRPDLLLVEEVSGCFRGMRDGSFVMGEVYPDENNPLAYKRPPVAFAPPSILASASSSSSLTEEERASVFIYLDLVDNREVDQGGNLQGARTFHKEETAAYTESVLAAYTSLPSPSSSPSPSSTMAHVPHVSDPGAAVAPPASSAPAPTAPSGGAPGTGVGGAATGGASAAPPAGGVAAFNDSLSSFLESQSPLGGMGDLNSERNRRMDEIMRQAAAQAKARFELDEEDEVMRKRLGDVRKKEREQAQQGGDDHKESDDPDGRPASLANTTSLMSEQKEDPEHKDENDLDADEDMSDDEEELDIPPAREASEDERKQAMAKARQVLIEKRAMKKAAKLLEKSNVKKDEKEAIMDILTKTNIAALEARKELTELRARAKAEKDERDKVEKDKRAASVAASRTKVSKLLEANIPNKSTRESIVASYNDQQILTMAREMKPPPLARTAQEREREMNRRTLNTLQHWHTGAGRSALPPPSDHTHQQLHQQNQGQTSVSAASDMSSMPSDYAACRNMEQVARLLQQTGKPLTHSLDWKLLGAPSTDNQSILASYAQIEPVTKYQPPSEHRVYEPGVGTNFSMKRIAEPVRLKTMRSIDENSFRDGVQDPRLRGVFTMDHDQVLYMGNSEQRLRRAFQTMPPMPDLQMMDDRNS